MYNLLLIPTFAAGLNSAGRDAAIAILTETASALPLASAPLVAPTLAGVYNGGDLICRFVFSDLRHCHAALESDAWAPAAAILSDRAKVALVERVTFRSGQSGGATAGPGLYRVALFCADVRPDPERLAAFAKDTATIAKHVRTIRRWQLSTADEAAGSRPWTHVWEQEYADLAGLNGAYMLHPVHWAHAERWFDPEYPERLVDPVLVHTFCNFDRPVIVAGNEGS